MSSKAQRCCPTLWQNYKDAGKLVDRAQTFGELSAMLHHERECAKKLAEKLATMYLRERDG